MIKIIKKNSGYTIIELLFYIALFSVLSVVVINAMLTMAKAFKETAIQAELVQSGTIMERMSREIRGAYDIDPTSTSTDLKLNTKDSGGANKTVELLLSGTNLELIENGTLTGNLNTSKINVTAVTFTQITTTQGKAVKIFLTIRSVDDILARTQDFYDTVVLRGSYQ
jgi:Tfp pilus assembly protein PilE